MNSHFCVFRFNLNHLFLFAFFRPLPALFFICYFCLFWRILSALLFHSFLSHIYDISALLSLFFFIFLILLILRLLFTPAISLFLPLLFLYEEINKNYRPYLHPLRKTIPFIVIPKSHHIKQCLTSRYGHLDFLFSLRSPKTWAILRKTCMVT